MAHFLGIDSRQSPGDRPARRASVRRPDWRRPPWPCGVRI